MPKSRRPDSEHTEHLAKAATFVAVVRAGSLAAAAKQLSVGKSTLSEQLTALEDALGARLLERTSRGLVLTQEGQVFFEGALKSLSAWEEAWSLAGQHQKRVAGTLRVAAPVGFEQFLAGVVKVLCKEHPELGYDLSFDDRPLDLVGDGFDIGLRMGSHPSSSLSVKKLGETPEVFVSASPSPTTLGALQSADWVCHSAFLHAYRNVRREGGEALTLTAPRVRGVANSTEGALRLVEVGLGIALMPELLVR
ncbi:MAG: LysR family transcriptional regulator [Myxococcales bacterium]|nr:LysR family transcriptional regulator [Myxococcales bacterium]